jgi:hypothetical protein
MLLLTLKTHDFVKKILVLGKLLNIVLRSQNQNFSKVGTGTGTATSHFGSTTLEKYMDSK